MTWHRTWETVLVLQLIHLLLNKGDGQEAIYKEGKVGENVLVCHIKEELLAAFQLWMQKSTVRFWPRCKVSNWHGCQKQFKLWWTIKLVIEILTFNLMRIVQTLYFQVCLFSVHHCTFPVFLAKHNEMRCETFSQCFIYLFSVQD